MQTDIDRNNDLTISHQATISKYFPNFSSDATNKIPGSLMILGDHTHYNEGITLAALVDREALCSVEITEEERTRLILESDKTEYEIDYEAVCSSLRCEVVRMTYLTLKEDGIIDRDINAVINYSIPECFGLGLYSSLAFVFTKTILDAFKVGYDKEKLMKLVKKIELASVGKISNRTHHHNFYNSFTGSLLKMDLRTDEATPLKFNYDDYRLLIVDTWKSIPEIRDTCNSRIEECEVGVKGLKLYVWGIKSLRDVNKDFLKKHINMIPKRVYSRVYFNVTERERVEKAIDLLEKNNYSELLSVISESHESLRSDYNLDYPELNFLQSEAIKLEGVVGSKLMSCSPIKSTYNIVHKDFTESFSKEIIKRFLEKYGKSPEIFELKLYK
ncbi:MAG: hypothetical protein SCALA702_07860 [Melioribacteraceae bacterium]|nr:MAG: hypothetical protein SCALA702_07860 [Melioribacteraceae bacterium]